MYSQIEIQKLVSPVIKSKGKKYKKFKNVFARKAKDVESITTITSDGKETINQARPGDYIVTNQTEAGEEYILSPPKFRKRYVYLKRSKNGYSEYQSMGRIQAIEVTPQFLKKMKLKDKFYFMASWGSKMVVKENDFLVLALGESSVYRIARKEFFETYAME